MEQGEIPWEWGPTRKLLERAIVDKYEREEPAKWKIEAGAKGIIDWWKGKGLSRGDMGRLLRIMAGHSRQLKCWKLKMGQAEDAMCRKCGEQEERLQHIMECEGTMVKRREGEWDENWRGRMMRNPQDGIKILKTLKFWG